MKNMTREDYLRNYHEGLRERDLEVYLDDDELAPKALKLFWDKAPEMFDAMVAFDLDPRALVTIIYEFGGSELIYKFEDLPLFWFIYDLYKEIKWDLIEPKEVHECYVKIHDLMAIEHSRLGSISDIDYFGQDRITADRALGHLVHLWHIRVLTEWVQKPPTGDDSYFDYYPGDILGLNAIENWFLGSNNRIK